VRVRSAKHLAVPAVRTCRSAAVPEAKAWLAAVPHLSRADHVRRGGGCVVAGEEPPKTGRTVRGIPQRL